MMSSQKPSPSHKNPAIKVLAGLLAHWQIIASATLLTTGVIGLQRTYNDYCGMTDLTYAPVEVTDSLKAAAETSGFRPGILAAQLETESHWRLNAASHAGAHGLAQFTEPTWERWGNGGDINDPHDAIDAQGRYLAYLQERLAPYIKTEADRLPITLAGYNAGPGAVESAGGVPPFFETEEYIRKITELSETKYKVTCEPDTDFKQERIIRTS